MTAARPRKLHASAAEGKDSSSAPEATLRLPADLGIESAEALHRELTAHVGRESPLMLDGHAVERLHAAGIQLLCALFRDRALAGRETGWTAASAALRTAAATLGAQAHLQLSCDTGNI
jgi:anti-anti-sigma regulatory factor